MQEGWTAVGRDWFVGEGLGFLAEKRRMDAVG